MIMGGCLIYKEIFTIISQIICNSQEFFKDYPETRSISFQAIFIDPTTVTKKTKDRK